jgi:hypothetical protein
MDNSGQITPFEIKNKDNSEESISDVYKISSSINPPWLTNFNDIDKTDSEIRVAYGKGLEGVNPEELREAVEYVQEAIIFIKENAETGIELKTVGALETLVNDGKIIIGDTSYDCGYPVYGFFHPDFDQKTGKDTSCIVLDYNAILAYGKAETIDTLMHESYHAAQHFAGHENDCVEEETRAWNLGLEMSNKYREQTGEYIAQTEPFSKEDIEDKGYRNDIGEGTFTEIVKGCPV